MWRMGRVKNVEECEGEGSAKEKAVKVEPIGR